MNKYALVTGGTKGIGKAVSSRLLKEGWDVIINYSHDDEAAEKTLFEFNSIYPDRVYLLKADISDLNSIQIIDNYIQERGIFLDAVVLNAGLTDRSDFRNINIDEWNKVFTANVHFPVFLLQKLYPRINPGSSIAFTGSLMAIQPHSVSLSYGVTKASVHALVKNLVKFFEDKKIRVNGVAPGFVESEWHKNKPQEIRNNITSKIALKRFSETDEIADVFYMLIKNTYINGEIIVCDGGYCYK
jgi:3-oxoacyl-[acyl-carrier protein] reductase